MKVSQKVPKSKHSKQHKNEPLSAPEITATISLSKTNEVAERC